MLYSNVESPNLSTCSFHSFVRLVFHPVLTQCLLSAGRWLVKSFCYLCLLSGGFVLTFFPTSLASFPESDWQVPANRCFSVPFRTAGSQLLREAPPSPSKLHMSWAQLSVHLPGHPTDVHKGHSIFT